MRIRLSQYLVAAVALALVAGGCKNNPANPDKGTRDGSPGQLDHATSDGRRDGGSKPGDGSKADAAGWQPVGGGTVAAGSAQWGRIASSNGVAYAAYEDGMQGNKLSVSKATASSWTIVGKAGFTPETVNDNYALAVDGSTPYVAFEAGSNSAISVMKYDGAAWVLVGAAGFATGMGRAMTLVVAGGTAYLAFLDSTNTPRVMSFSGSAWTSQGGSSALPTSSRAPALTVDSGTVWAAITDGSSVTLYKLSGGSWVSVATSDALAIDEDWGASISVSNGTVYLFFYDGSQGAVVLKLTGSTLTSVGTKGSIANGDPIEYVSGTVYHGVPYVGYDDEAKDSDAQPRAATVKTFNGTSWVLVADYPSTCDIENTLLIAGQGVLYFTYTDCNNNMYVQQLVVP